MSNYAIWNLFGPISWIFWLALLALLTAHRRPRLSRKLLIASISWFAVGGLLPLGFWLIIPLEQRFPQLGRLAVPKSAMIAVLGGAESFGASRHAGRPEFNSHANRVLAGAALATSIPNAPLAIVGGVSESGYPDRDVDLTARMWSAVGVPSTQIVKIAGTVDTCTNALGVGRTTRAPVLLVTSAFHMPRSIACFRAAGIEPIPFPVDYQTPPPSEWKSAWRGDIISNFERVDLALHEYAGLLVYRLQGRTSELWPAAKVASAARPRETQPSATSP